MRIPPITDGDLALEMTNDGADISVVDGQPAMDQGFITAIIISLYTNTGFWANVLEADPVYRLGQGFQEAISGPITSAMLREAESAAELSLAWMIETGIARSVNVSIDNPSADRIKTTVTITKPDGSNLIWEGV